MDRLQVVTQVDCPEHSTETLKYKLTVVVEVDDSGHVEVWRGCVYCPGSQAHLTK